MDEADRGDPAAAFPGEPDDPLVPVEIPVTAAHRADSLQASSPSPHPTSTAAPHRSGTAAITSFNAIGSFFLV